MDPRLSDLESQLKSVMLRDRFRLKRSIDRLRADSKKAELNETKLEKLTDDFAKSSQLRQQRLDKLPKPLVDSELPIYERQAEIIDTIQNHQVVVISGETGSGKSTQLPLMALLAGFGIGAPHQEKAQGFQTGFPL